MKTVGIILTICALQALALPSMVEIPKVERQNDPETVAAFRAAIDSHVTRFQALYDSINNQMRNYRILHVQSIHENYHEIMHNFGYTINRARGLGTNNYTINSIINACARRANETMTDALSTYFYPTFRLVQDTTSPIPLLTMDALRRGNVFNDKNDEVLNYLEMQYEAYILQWIQTVSKFFRWEKTKVDVTGDYYQEEMNMCLCQAIPEGSVCMEMPIVPGKSLEL